MQNVLVALCLTIINVSSLNHQPCVPLSLQSDRFQRVLKLYNPSHNGNSLTFFIVTYLSEPFR